MRGGCLILALSLSGCAAGGPPLVDMTDVNPVTYQRDFDQCQIEGQDVDRAGPILVGALMGGTFGLGIGAMAATGPAVALGSSAAGYGGAAGAVAGAGVSGVANAPLAAPPPAPRQTVAQCLTAHGYTVIAR